MKQIILLSAIIFCCVMLAAQPGKFDSSFGVNGIVKAGFGVTSNCDNYTEGKQVLLAPDGSIFIVADVYGKTIIAKKLSDGSTDLTYGDHGFSTPLDISNAHAVLQKDNKIVVAGAALARLKTDGTPDSTYGINGIQALGFYIETIAIQPDEKIILAGRSNTYDFQVTRYTTDGIPDSSFSQDGKQVTVFLTAGSYYTQSSAKSVAIASDGKIIVLGFTPTNNGPKVCFARYNTDGTLDNSFDSDGKLITDNSYSGSSYSLAIQPDRKLAITTSLTVTVYNGPFISRSDTYFFVARYETNGSIDVTFGDQGKQITDATPFDDYASSIAIQHDGKIVVAGTSFGKDTSYFLIVRYDQNGTLDNSFGNDGIQTTTFTSRNIATSVVIQPDDKILIGGNSRFVVGSYGASFSVARYESNGTPDVTFDSDGKLTGTYCAYVGSAFYSSVAIQSDGKLLVGGTVLARYKNDGSFDSTFNRIGYIDHGTSSVAIQKDGKILAVIDSALARYNIDGSPDKTFASNGKLSIDYSIVSMAIQSDGKIVVGGIDFQPGINIYMLVRYNTDGSLDNSFSGDGKQIVDFIITSIALTSDGKIIVGGEAFARFNADGSLDNTFGADGIQPTQYWLAAIAVQNDGKIVGAGSTSAPDGAGNFTLERYNTDGSLDVTEVVSFGDYQNAGFVTVSSIGIQNNGSIVVGGSVTENSALVWFGPDGSFSETFKIPISKGVDAIQGIAIKNNRLYTAGYAQEFLSDLGVVTSFLLANENQNAGPEVTSFTLVNADTDDDIQTIPDGSTLDINILPRYVNIRANTNPHKVGSVVFILDGKKVRTENGVPYALAGDNPSGDYHNWMLPLGDHTLTAIPYSKYNGKGTEGTALTIHFTVVGQRVESFTLINAETDKSIQSISDGAVIDLNELPTNQINIRANTNPGKVGSVVFMLDGKKVRTENGAPYALAGDNPSGDYHAWTLSPGDHTLTAIPYSDYNGKGTEGVSLTIHFTVVNNYANLITSADGLNIPGEVRKAGLYPNPVNKILNITLEDFGAYGKSTVSIINSTGAIMKIIQVNSRSKIVQLNVSSLATGTYFIKIVSGNRLIERRFVKQ